MIESAFRLLPEIDSPGLEIVTRSLSEDISAKARSHLLAKGASLLRENSRRQVAALGPGTFYKSLTSDSARRLRNFYTPLERASADAGFVPKLISIESLDETASVASFEYVDGTDGTVRDTRECLRLYTELQYSARRFSMRAAEAILRVCHAEVSTWDNELLRAWDPFHWNDPKILHWAGVDAAALVDVGVPGLLTVGSLIGALDSDGVCVPVHADLYTGNFMRTSRGRGVIFDWDEGYWGLPGMGLQILLREAIDGRVKDFDYDTVLSRVSQLTGLGLTERDLALRTLASAIIEIAGVRQSLREMGRTRERHGAYLAAWACRYEWIIRKACG